MNLLVISDLQAAGGAAIACQRMIQNLVTHENVSVLHCVRHKAFDTTSHTVAELSNPLRLQALANRVEVWSYPLATAIRKAGLKKAIAQHIGTFAPDIINIHNIHGAKDWGIDIVDLCARHRPVVWTLHDMWSFTGSCAYTGNCCHYIRGCHEDCTCPDAIPKCPADKLAAAWQRKKTVLTKWPQTTAVCPSQWLSDCAQQGLWSDHKVAVIPYNLPLDIYKPTDKAAVRKQLKIPPGAPVILTVAESLADQRKGMHILQAALNIYAPPNATLLTVGRDAFDWKIDGLTLHHLGYVSTDPARAQAYQAADILIHPALEDNLPNTIAEATACGTPTIAFATGGIPEMIIDGSTGWLAPEITAPSLAATLERAVNDGLAAEVRSSRCRAYAETRYGAVQHAEKHLQLFRALMNQEHRIHA